MGKSYLFIIVSFTLALLTACNQGNTPSKQNASGLSNAPGQQGVRSDGSHPSIQSVSSPARIHIVRPGQTLWNISQQYGVSAESISQVNELLAPDHLVVGQAMVIPHAQGARFASGNVNRGIDVNAYIEPKAITAKDKTTVSQISPHLTYLAPFSFRIKRDGTLQVPPLDNLPALARDHQAISMMVVTNLENDQFSAELGGLILHNDQLSTTLIDNIIWNAQQLHFKDIHFDIEHIKPTDREAYNSFLRKAAKRIKGAGLLFSTALAPKTSASQKGAWYTAHDYRTHGEVADFVVIMTYEWGFSGGPPMPVSPLPSVRKVLEYAITEIPPEKIMMGQNLYGYDWTLPYKPGGQYAHALSPQKAIDLARERNVAIEYDNHAEAPYFSYTDDANKDHMVWFEDARSIQAKFNLVKELGLRGISYWKLGLPFPQNWALLEQNFHVRKR